MAANVPKRGFSVTTVAKGTNEANFEHAFHHRDTDFALAAVSPTTKEKIRVKKLSFKVPGSTQQVLCNTVLSTKWLQILL